MVVPEPTVPDQLVVVVAVLVVLRLSALQDPGLLVAQR
jgi:hypothetical protein